MDLLPPPRLLRPRPGRCAFPRRIRRLLESSGRPEPEAYQLIIAQDGVTLRAATTAGLAHAARTLAQIRLISHPRSLPCLEILDWPVFPVRGFYHDVTRGKVPTLKTLLDLAETCARFKINQLQLYIEHTYAFRNHPEVWAGADPLTAEEIRALDQRCAELHIDLVPSFSTFGHFHTWIARKFPELNELEHDVSRDPFNWWDRMAHSTLDCQNPRSIQLVREIISEVRPLFRSRFFNICADETFDLGKGRNKALAERLGVGRLYVDFLKKIIAIVHDHHAIPMFWADIIGQHPGLLTEIPPDAIALDWDYSPELMNTKATFLAKAGRPFYVCPGTSGWNTGLPDYARAHRNITRFARLGHRHGATGLLNTDWGDYGHINALGLSFPGLILGASAAWHPSSPALHRTAFERSASRLIFGDSTGRLLGLLRRAASATRATWMMTAWTQQPRSRDFPDDWFHQPTGLPNGMFKHSARAHAAALHSIRTIERKVLRLLPRCKPPDRLIPAEIRCAFRLIKALESFHLLAHHRAGRARSCSACPRATAREILVLDRDLARIWLKRNKPSELHHVRTVLQKAAAWCLSSS